ncbi:hypothetical protein [Gorillibacterium timonense]|uniref:hypothetical protein n=1 Tax=Gorillibacterium timonense TaxID=1689269 RepID=UPI00071C3DE5|nr:hypothetical protein [Gorillibacterium timonense]
MKKIMIASCVRKKPEILACYLSSLASLEIREADIHYCFIDDNDDETSRFLLKQFQQDHPCVTILPGENADAYVCDDETHYWTDRLVEKVTQYKNRFLSLSRERDCDYLFLADADLVFHPLTLQSLMDSGKDIISEIFWTKWDPNDRMPMPNVWLIDNYSTYVQGKDERLSATHKALRSMEFLHQLRSPGVYRVGGLGASTLVSKKAIQSPLNFNKIYNISFWGEDRHFCIRAVVLGFTLYVDTHYPAYHIYRDADLSGVEDYVNRCRDMKSSNRSGGLESGAAAK